MMSLPTPYYDDGRIQMYHGDCREILPLLPSVDLVLTDPPYGFGQSDQRRHARTAADPGRNGGFAEIEGDRQVFDPSPLLGYRRVILFGANHYAHLLPSSPGWIVWDKRNGATPDVNADAELIWTNQPGVVRMYRQCWRGFTREDDGLEPQKHVHPTQKPVKLMMWLLERFSKAGDLVLDPYMGSGPVARACQLLGRRYIGIEIDQRYVEVAATRLQQAVLPLAAETRTERALRWLEDQPLFPSKEAFDEAMRQGPPEWVNDLRQAHMNAEAS